MVDQKLTALTANTTPVAADLVYVVKDPSGTPLSRKMTVANLFTYGSPAYPLSAITGLTLSNNGVDATNDIDIAAGKAVDGTGAYNITLAASLTKRLDAAWAVGTGNGGLDTGVIANDWYHMWLIARSDTGVVDALFSASATAPTMPASYDYKRRIGAVLRTAAALKTFTQWGDEFVWLAPVLDQSVTNLTTSRVNYTLASVPDGLVVKAILNVSIDHASAKRYVYISNPNLTDSAPSDTVAPLASGNALGSGGSNHQGPKNYLTNSSAQISARADGSSTIFRVATLGWIDPRGKW